jgi:hypothetical protein
MFFKKNDTKECQNFPDDVENFAILLKGSSLDKIGSFYDRFNKCFIISDYDDELNSIGTFLEGKDITHFTNRSRQSTLSKDNYIKYKIKNIQTGQVFRWRHFRLIETFFYYKRLAIGLHVRPLPEIMLKYHLSMPEEYHMKFPNTGILSIMYALIIIRPKILWVFGLDFYSRPYMVSQTQGTPLSLEAQSDKLERLNLPKFVIELIKDHPETKVMMASYYDGWPKLNNMRLV